MTSLLFKKKISSGCELLSINQCLEVSCKADQIMSAKRE